MMKKILGLALSAAIVLNILPSALADYTDVPENSEVYDAVELLSDMKIVSGYTDGSFKPYKTLSRAEFAKLIVMIYDKQNDVQFNSLISGFKDVAQGAWYVGYVNYISQNGIINGYADGTFGPDKAITYAEAVTILCRILGYKEESVGYYWPNNYLSQAASMGLSDGFIFGSNEPITRGAAAVLIERILFMNVPGSSAAATGGKDLKLIEYLGYTLVEDSYVLATRNENESLTSKQIKTASGVYEMADGTNVPKAGTAGSIILSSDNKAVGMKIEKMVSKTVYVTNVPETNTIEYRTAEGETGRYKFDTSFMTYYDYNKLTYSQSASYIDVDTEITFYGSAENEWKFAVIDDDSSGNIPVLASKDYSDSDRYIGSTAINMTNLKIYRNGEGASLSDIKKNDVIYYNTKTNVIDVYSNKVSGIYTDAYPNKAHVTSVKVAGKTYELSSSGKAKSALDASSGSFAIGEKVTLLLGKNDKVEFAVELADFDYFDYGVLLGCTKGVSEYEYNEGVSQITAQIFMPDGNTYTYAVTKDFDDSLKGKLVKLSYEGDKVSLSSAENEKITGSLDIQGRRFAGKTVLKDVKVIHRLSKEDADNVSVETLNFDTLGINELTARQVITVVEANAFGDIGILYLENLESGYDFGFLVGSEKIGDGEMSTYQYEIFSDGITTKYPNSVRFSVSPRTPSYYKTDGNSITEIYNMKKIDSASGYDAAEGGRIKLNNKVYDLADDFKIVYVEDSAMAKFKTVSLSEMKNMKITSISLYSEKDEGTASVIKMIVLD